MLTTKNQIMKTLTLIMLLLILHSLVLFGQGKVVDDPGDGPKWISKKSFGTMLHERFKDSIPGLDSMNFLITIDRKGYVKKVVYLENYFAPKINSLDLKRMMKFIKEYMYWQPAWVPKGGKVIHFKCSIYEFVNPDTIEKIMSQPYKPFFNQ